ncbi:MAG: trypsin-like peptidase domain-containing protein [Mariniblastus sp.]
MRIKLYCPHCNAQNDLAISLLGSQHKCTGCGTSFLAEDTSNRDLMPPGKAGPKFVPGLRELSPSSGASKSKTTSKKLAQSKTSAQPRKPADSSPKQLIDEAFELSEPEGAESGDGSDTAISDSNIGNDFEYDFSPQDLDRLSQPGTSSFSQNSNSQNSNSQNSHAKDTEANPSTNSSNVLNRKLKFSNPPTNESRSRAPLKTYSSPVTSGYSMRPVGASNSTAPLPPVASGGFNAEPPPLEPRRIKPSQTMSPGMLVGLVGGILALGLVVFGFAFVINLTRPTPVAKVDDKVVGQVDGRGDGTELADGDANQADNFVDGPGLAGLPIVEDGDDLAGQDAGGGVEIENDDNEGAGESLLGGRDDDAPLLGGRDEAESANDGDEGQMKGLVEDEKVEDGEVENPLKRAAPENFAAGIDQLKAATVFIKTKITGGSQTGSGFLISVDGNEGIVVTNAHVIQPERGRLMGIDCVFNSGTKDEFSASARVIGKDVQEDLAILKVKRVGLPDPIEIDDDLKLQETLPVFILGFPFGEMLKTAKNRNPSITISRGAIASLRRDDYDNIVLVQVDGGINPGNSGGPIVTEDGKLVGISVAKLKKADIGIAIPNRILAETRRGRLAFVSVSVRQRSYDMTANFVDPHNNIKSATLLVFEKRDQEVGMPSEKGLWSAAAKNAKEYDLDLEEGIGVASVRRKVGNGGRQQMFQVRFTRNDGAVLYSSPNDLRPISEPRVQRGGGR